MQYNFPKMRVGGGGGGGVKGRLEFFQKVIRFGCWTLPLLSYNIDIGEDCQRRIFVWLRLEEAAPDIVHQQDHPRIKLAPDQTIILGTFS